MTETTEVVDAVDEAATPSKEEQEAKRYVKRLKRFYMQVVWAGVLVGFLFIINLLTSTEYWWFLWPAFGLGIALAAQAVSLFGFNDMFGADWEKRQVEKRLNR